MSVRMKDYFDPIYQTTPASGGAGFKRPEGSRGVKKSHSIIGGGGNSSSGSVIGKFLKLGKSKSDASKRRPSSNYGGSGFDDDLEDFRLSPSVVNRGVSSGGNSGGCGPVERMVHHKQKKDVSRSHSWIYGSVKLPSDLPFGYGYHNPHGLGSQGSGSGGSDTSGSHPSPSSGVSVQIPRCSMMMGASEFYQNCPDCEVGNCKACAQEFNNNNNHYHSPYQQWALPHSKSKDSSFVNSMRKLTWKSLKQAVKKRPSLDNMKLPNQVSSSELRVGNSNVVYDAPIIHHGGGGGPTTFSAEDMQNPSYFFPEKKSLYASCTELFKGTSGATASVRLRPKPSRQSWQFTNGGESGPMPNYCEDDSSVYHSEWDLRQCIPYDVWVNTTSHVKPRTTPKTPNGSLSKSTSVPYLNSNSNGKGSTSSRKSGGSSRRLIMHDDDEEDDGGTLRLRSSSSGVLNADTMSLRSVASTVTSKKSRTKSPSPSMTRLTTRPSILTPDVSAYQLIKKNTPITTTTNGKRSATPVSSRHEEEDVLSTSSDDLSDNAVTSLPPPAMRIGGQKIYMPPTSSVSQCQINKRTSTNVTPSNRGGNKANNAASKSNNKKGVRSSEEWTSSSKMIASSSSKPGQSQSASAPKSRVQNQTTGSNNKTPASATSRTNVNQSRNLHLRGESGPPPPRSSPSTSKVTKTPNKAVTPPVVSNSAPNNNVSNKQQQPNNYHTNRDLSSEENYQVEFEEFVFVEEKTHDNEYEDEHQKTHNYHSNNNRSNNVNIVGQSETTTPQYLNGDNKFGALRRRKSRNGSSASCSSSGKLSREVIYEEEVDEWTPMNRTSPPIRKSQPLNRDEFAVKIVVPPSLSPLEYVNKKSILKKGSYNSNDETESVYSDSSTLKKKVQFDPGRVVVCGGDTTEESDHDESVEEESSVSVAVVGGKVRSAFEEEVARKAASFALSRKRHEEAEAEAEMLRRKLAEDTVVEVNALPPKQVHSHQNQFTSSTGRKSSNPAPSSLKSSQGSIKGGTDECVAATAKERHNLFTKHSKTAASHGVAAQVMKAKRIASSNTNTNPANPSSTGATGRVLRMQHNDSAKTEVSVTNTPPPRPPLPRTSPSPSVPVLLNPNALLFNDTTRIRLNQTRPSLNDTFSLNISTDSKKKPITRLTQSSSFRSTTNSAPLRPREPPPPPPPSHNRLIKGKPLSSSTSQIYANTTNLSLLSTNRLLPSLLSKSEISLPMDVQTTSNQANVSRAIKNQIEHQANDIDNNKGNYGGAKTRPTIKKASGGILKTSKNEETTLSKPSITRKPVHLLKNDNKSIEIVTKENSVSEIRIYSSNNETSHEVSKKPQETHYYAATDVLLSNNNNKGQFRQPPLPPIPPKLKGETFGNKRPNSTSVVLIGDNNNNGNSHPAPPTYSVPIDTLSRKTPTVLQLDEEEEDPLYDDVALKRVQSQQEVIESSLPCGACPPSLPPPNLPSKSLSEYKMKPLVLGEEDLGESSTYCDMVRLDLDEEVDNLYNDISDVPKTKSLQSFASSMKGALLNAIKNMNISESQGGDRRSVHSNDSGSTSTTLKKDAYIDNFIYDDTLSLRSGASGGSKKLKSFFDGSGSLKSVKSQLTPSVLSTSSSSRTLQMKDREEGEPLYDDVMMKLSSSSKTDNGSSDSGAESEDATPPPLPTQGPPKLSSSSSSELILLMTPEEEVKTKEKDAEAVLTRTRSLLHELNEKLCQLNSLNSSVQTQIHTANNPSSSESSGVEEDYNSEKNYSLSNSTTSSDPDVMMTTASLSPDDDTYKLAQVSKLVSETISMARGKFLDSMKTTDHHEEPIYEEIGELMMNRSHSPIYADAFDAKSIFDGASRNDILTFLESIRDRLTTTSDSSGSQSSSVSSKKGQTLRSLASSSPDEAATLTFLEEEPSIATTSHEEASSSCEVLILRKLCPDCNDAPLDGNPHLCSPCGRKRSERKEIITEIVETEVKYGRDLRIISEEFYRPIQIAGLLSKEQLDQIFLNVLELIQISATLTECLQREIEAVAVACQDEDLVGVNVGKIFLEIGEGMMTAFQTYCTRQASAGSLLAQLEKEKELLRIFLRVSQMENTVLRRMNLPAFLMVPVQRVTRYPLLLSRLLKVTPLDHFSREELQSAHERIELHLDSMNKATREVASIRLWRRISIINGSTTPVPRRSNNDLEGASVSIKKMSIDVLDWSNFTDINCILDNQLGVFHFNGKPLRGIFACLLVRGKELDKLAAKMEAGDMFFPPSEDIVKEVKLILVRVKNTRFCLLREPLCLSKCVVSQGDGEFEGWVEINEITTKNTYYLQGLDKPDTVTWLKALQAYSLCVGQWRRRRGALANIVMNGMLKHL